MRQKFVMRDSQRVYVAERVPGLCEPLPSWFDVVMRAGKLAMCDMTGQLSVRQITGSWIALNPGDWLVVGDNHYVYGIEHDDFVRSYTEI